MAQVKEKRKKIDMTKGSIIRNVLLFAIPIVIGNILQQMYTTVDTLVVSYYCGDKALAAVGTSSQPVEVLLCVFLGIGTGVSILVSQKIGAGDEKKVAELSATATSFVYLSGIPIAIIGFIATPYILKFMGVPADVWNNALIYTRVVFIGALGNIGYNMNAGILRGLGDSVASLWFLVVSCVTNIILDLLFVAGLGMDVRGAAIATSTSMFLSWIVSIFYIQKKFPELKFTILPKTLDMGDMKSILALGLPIGLNNSLFSFGHMAMQTLVNAQGYQFMAGASVAGRITGITNVAITAVSAAASTFSGQNYGARNYDRLRQGYIMIPAINGIATLALGMIFISFRMPILKFFSQDEMVLVYASRYVVAVLISQWCFAVFNSISNMVNGVGFVRYTTVINLMMLWAVRIPCAYLIDRFFDGTYIMFCFPVSFVFGMTCMIGYYIFSPDWKKIISKGRGRRGSGIPLGTFRIPS
ncbi:MATE family efflux transporter [Butyrivibrio sp. CB08]|uniref:MATE family efflux transporter n=1 Tax=Butyrivibrio sp. CB08 TaxID=2364879 RepID=UPI000EA9F987|nr:MATE family efflux transporter [Butyrivibrio sp. CB08]RKM61908.1 MATE family efflux transporter [Butyrivibrio sp. CB08]